MQIACLKGQYAVTCTVMQTREGQPDLWTPSMYNENWQHAQSCRLVPARGFVA